MSHKKQLMHILYGSETGIAESISEQIYEDSVSLGYNVVHHCLKDEGEKFHMSELKVAIIVCSTTGDGDPPGNARKFVKKLLSPEYSGQNIVGDLRYALLGLGDTNYTNFAGGPKRLERALKKQGATSFCETAFADDGTDLEGTVEPWIENLFEGGALEKFLSEYESIRLLSAKTNALSIPATKPVNTLSVIEINDASKHELTPDEDEESDNSDLLIPDLIQDTALSSATLSLPPLFPIHLQLQYLDEESTPDNRIENALPYAVSSGDVVYCNISEARSLTRRDAVKHCIEMKFTAEDLFPYCPGDSFGISCQNDALEVEWLIKRLSIEDVADKTAKLTIVEGVKKSASIPKFLPHIFTIRQVLTNCLELRSVPKKPLLRVLSSCTSNEIEKRRLHELCSKQGSAGYTDFIRTPGLCILDVLAAFPSCKPSIEVLLQHLPRIQLRRYSVSSSPLEDPKSMTFAFNVIEFDSTRNRALARKGVCTGYLDQLLSENKWSDVKIPVFPTKNTGFSLPTDPSTPIVMIGPGTGVAPFVGFLKHRELSHQSSSPDQDNRASESWLFFGCRHKERDYLFQNTLDQFVSIGVLTHLVVSFSRDVDTLDNAKPKYVQDNMKLHASSLYRLITETNAVFYICGDASNMARDVRQCMIDIIKDKKLCDLDQANTFFKEFVESKRYKEDIWA